MKNILIPLLIALLLGSCKDKNSYTIHGTINIENHFDKDVIYIIKENDDYTNSVIADTAKIINGKFTFNGTIIEPELINLSFEVPDKADIYYTIILEPGDIYIDITDNDMFNLSGTKRNEQWNDIQKRREGYNNELNKLYEKETLSIEEIDTFNILSKKDGDIIYAFIKPNINNKIGENLFYFMNWIMDTDQAGELYDLLNPEVKEIDRIKSLKTKLEAEKNVIKGKKFIDMEGITPDGKTVSLSDYAGKGKFVLIDFWASWCGPCMRDIPVIMKTYEQYKDKDFEVIGISMDDDKDSWINAISKLGISWPQISDLQGRKSKFLDAYPVFPIPYTILLDRDGYIIDTNIRGNMLSAKLEQILNTSK